MSHRERFSRERTILNNCRKEGVFIDSREEETNIALLGAQSSGNLLSMHIIDFDTFFIL